jgi:hypothetical protein
MSSPKDFHDDISQQTLYAIEHLHGLPTFVKEAAVEGKDEVDKIPSSSFADPRHRKFPCHTKAATWLSNAYFQNSKDAYSKDEEALVQERIIKAAEYWSIRTLVKNFNSNHVKMASYDDSNLQDEDYALVAEFDGKVVRRFPIPNAPSVKAAGEYLYAHRFDYPYPWRKAAARRILAKAVEYDEKAENGEKVASQILRFEPQTLEYLQRAAGLGMTHPQWAAEKIAQRVYMLPDRLRSYQRKLAELAVEFRKLPSCTHQQMSKLAAVLDTVDRETGLCRNYHEGVEMPEEICFTVLKKEAEDILDSYITLQTGNAYPVGLLASLPLEKVAGVLGEAFTDQVKTPDGNLDITKFAEILPTLPRPDAKLIERVLEESMKGPIAKAAAAGRKMMESELRKVARLKFRKASEIDPKALAAETQAKMDEANTGDPTQPKVTVIGDRIP